MTCSCMSQLVHYNLIICQILTIFIQYFSNSFYTNIENMIFFLTTCEVCSVVHFLLAEGNCVAQIHRLLCDVYSNTVMSDKDSDR